MLYRVEVWHREGERQPSKLPEQRKMVRLFEELEANTGLEAAHKAAEWFGLTDPRQYFVGPRPPYVIRVFEQYKRGKRTKGSGA